jgi:ribosomal protein L19E
MPQYIDSPYKAEIKALRDDVKRLEEDKEIYKRQFRSIQIQLEAWVEDYYRLQDKPFS